MPNKVRESIESIVECSGKWATIRKISRNPALAATEIRTIQDENRRLCPQLACMVFFDVIVKDNRIVLSLVSAHNTEHRHSGVVFWRCLTDGGQQHQQIDDSRV